MSLSVSNAQENRKHWKYWFLLL